MFKSLQNLLIALVTLLVIPPVSFGQTLPLNINFSSAPSNLTFSSNNADLIPSWVPDPLSNYYITATPTKNTNYYIHTANIIPANITDEYVTVTWNGNISTGSENMTLAHRSNSTEKFEEAAVVYSNQPWGVNSATISLLNNKGEIVPYLELRFTFISTGIGTGGNKTYPTYSIDNLKVNSGITPLPVSLVSFTGKAVTGKNQLNWNTASEKNNDRFEIQKSLDGKNFITIGEVKPTSANSNAAKSYSFVDQNAIAEVSYYRLKQVDLDGTPAFSPIVLVRNSQALQFAVYPTLVTNFIEIQLSKAMPGGQTVEIVDYKGMVVKKIAISISSSVNVEDLTPGIYFVKVAGTANNSLIRFVKI